VPGTPNKSMKKILILLLLGAGTQQALLSQKITLKECIATAIANNIGVKQRGLQAEAAGINHQQAIHNRLPSVASGYNYAINNGRTIDPFTNAYITEQLKSSSANVSASIPLFNGFLLKHTIKQNEWAFAAAKMEGQQAKDELTLQVILAYLQVLSSQDAVKLAQQQAEVTQQQKIRIEDVGNEGATPPANVSDLQGQYAGDEIAVVATENSYENALLALAQLMQVPYNPALELDRTGIPEQLQQFTSSPDEVYNLATQQLASVKAVNMRLSSSEARIKAAKGNLYPSLSFFGGASTNYSNAALSNTLINSTEVETGLFVDYNSERLKVKSIQNNYNQKTIPYFNQFKNNISYGFGLQMSIPILNAFQARNTIKLARNNEKATRLVADNTYYALRQAIEQACFNIKATYKRYTLLQQQAAAFTESYRITTLRFENGVINSPEYLIAKNNMDRANANLLIARYEFLLRKKILDFYMGALN
jgi:outer membrane protein